MPPISIIRAASHSSQYKASRQTTDPAPTPAKDLHRFAASRFPPHQYPTTASAPPPTIYTQGHDTHTHNNRPNPGPYHQGATNKVTGRLAAGVQRPVISLGRRALTRPVRRS